MSDALMPGMSPKWEPAMRGDDGIMSVAEPFPLRPADWQQIPTILHTVMVAAFDEATAWGAEMDLTVHAEPDPGIPLDFLMIDIDGRRPWHSTNATFMAPSASVPDEAARVLETRGWQGVGTGGPIYKVWDDVPIDAVANEIGEVALAIFDPEIHRFWELSVTVLAPEDDTETYYEVFASATRPVLQRAVQTTLGDPSAPDDADAWIEACRDLGFDPDDIPLVARVTTPDETAHPPTDN